MGYSFSVHQQKWPTWDERLTQEEKIILAVQVNGKTRTTIELEDGTSESEAYHTAMDVSEVRKHLQGRKIVRKIYVPGKILNLLTQAE
jgi:leucyl-tRNA synthetase